MQVLSKFEYSKHIKIEMRHKGPKMTYFNQQEEDLEKTWLGETIEPKESTRFTKEEWQTDTTRHHRV